MRFLLPYLAYSYIRLVGATARLRVLGAEHVEAARRASPNSRVLYAFWHCQQIFFVYSHRNSGINILVSQSRDGDIVAKTMALAGINASRGSSSRGAAAATLSMMESSEIGRDIGMTPDGPRGPARQVKPGILYLAQKLNLSIIPIANAQSRRLILKRSWDQYRVPLPFSRAIVVHGEPIRVSPNDDLEAKALQLKTALDAVSRQAEDAVA